MKEHLHYIFFFANNFFNYIPVWCIKTVYTYSVYNYTPLFDFIVKERAPEYKFKNRTLKKNLNKAGASNVK